MTVFDEAGVLMVKMDRHEALATIRSLTEQLISGSSNTGRVETILDDDGRDFSVAVVTKTGEST